MSTSIYDATVTLRTALPVLICWYWFLIKLVKF